MCLTDLLQHLLSSFFSILTYNFNHVLKVLYHIKDSLVLFVFLLPINSRWCVQGHTPHSLTVSQEEKIFSYTSSLH